jgi:hypothetical protein
VENTNYEAPIISSLFDHHIILSTLFSNSMQQTGGSSFGILTPINTAAMGKSYYLLALKMSVYQISPNYQ